MKSLSYSLKQFRPAGLEHKIKITGNIERRSGILSLKYALSGPLQNIVIPPQSDLPSRKYGLWEETCFEFFLCTETSDNYWEFNMSPAGHWNVYRFTSYRTGMREEPAFQSLPFSVMVRDGALCLSLEIDMNKILPAAHSLKAAVSAVINTLNDGLSYWALAHPGIRPDFHLRESFILEL